MQSDYNIVLYCSGEVVWHTGSNTKTHSGLVLDADGNLKYEHPAGTGFVYKTDRDDLKTARMILFVTNDCRLVLCAESVVVWVAVLDDLAAAPRC